MGATAGRARADAPDAADCAQVPAHAGLTAPAFQRAVLAALDAVEGLVVGPVRPFQARVTWAGKAYDLRLDEPFKRHRHGALEPAAAADEIKAALGIPGAATVREGPFPRIARRDGLAPGVHHLACPFDDELAVFLVWRLPLGHVPLAADEVAQHPDGQALWAAALANLRARTERVGAAGGGTGAGLVLRFASGDGLDASAALLPDLLDTMAGWVVGRLHVAIPTRDILLACGDADPVLLAEVAGAAAEAFEAGPEGLSPRLYALDETGRLRAAADIGAAARGPGGG